MHTFHSGLQNRLTKQENASSKLDFEDMRSPHKVNNADQEVFSRQMSLFSKNRGKHQEERKGSIKSVGSQK
jgi:hypothetical protein